MYHFGTLDNNDEIFGPGQGLDFDFAHSDVHSEPYIPKHAPEHEGLTARVPDFLLRECGISAIDMLHRRLHVAEEYGDEGASLALSNTLARLELVSDANVGGSAVILG